MFGINALINKTREKCGRGIRRKVSLQTAIPCNWKEFLHNSKSKIELFDFLTKPVSEYQFENKEVQITNRNTMLTVAVAGTNSIDIYTHKEADTRIIIRLLDAAEKGMKNIIIRTVDSDILRIVLGQFELTRQKHNNLSVCVGLGKGQDYIVYDMNETFINIGTLVSTSSPFFHVLRGADDMSRFHRKNKLVLWEA